MIYPITFCIPESKIVTAVPRKTKQWAHIVPGDTSTYIFKNEQDYYADYQTAVYGRTKKKAGWDCLRHYEILANGCIPWFEDLDKCPPNTMTHFPKEKVLELMRASALRPMPEDITAGIEWLLAYTRKHLTTKAMAQYVLDKSGHAGATRVLYLSQDPRPDYLRCLLLHGFKELLGPACHDSIAVPHLYTEYIGAEGLYGKGISYTCLLNKADYRNPWADDTVLKDIAAHWYDVIIYGSVHRGMPLWDHVCRHYAAKDVILMCGEDLHTCTYTRLAATHDVFIREL